MPGRFRRGCTVAVAALALFRVATATAAAPAVRVSGNGLVDGTGQPLQLRGVNRSGTEYACADGYSIFDGPDYQSPNLSQPQSTIDAMKSWGINAVRVPLNEHCWLGVNGVDPLYGGAAYRQAIGDYVAQLLASDMNVILDLHVVGPGSRLNDGDPEYGLPDADHAPAFWSSVATAFQAEAGVIFDLYNEAHLDSLDPDQTSTVDWTCWRDGCDLPDPAGGGTYTAAGMQQLVDAVRATGATNTVILSGLSYANHLERWNEFEPNDPTGQIAASWHNYPTLLGGAGGDCTTRSCWALQVADKPVVTGEFGQAHCRHGYADRYMKWADANGGISYLAWAWDATDGAWDCSAGPALIQHYDGTPTKYGKGVRRHYQARAF